MPIYTTPERLILIDIDRSTENDPDLISELQVQFNPAEFTRSINAVYHEHEVLGQSFAPQEYLRTANQEINFSVRFIVDAFNTPAAPNRSATENGRRALERLQIAERFIESFMYPPRASSFLSNSPSRMLVLWPNTMSLRCRLHSATFKHDAFNSAGHTTGMTINLTLKEAAVRRITKSRVLTDGLFRASRGADQKG